MRRLFDLPGTAPDPIPGAWRVPSPPAVRPPERVDVAVIGAGLCGLHCALMLAEAGLSVSVFDQRGPGQGGRRVCGGQFHAGVGGTYLRLSRGLGAPRARQLWHLTLDGQRLLRSFWASRGIEAELLRGDAPTGHLRVALTDGEAEELLECAQALRLAQMPGQLLAGAAELSRKAPGMEGVRNALWEPEGGTLLLSSALSGLTDRALDAGVGFHPVRVERLDTGAGGACELVFEGGRTLADFAVVAAGAWSGHLLGMLADIILPVREQMATVALDASAWMPHPVSARNGWISWSAAEGGGVNIRGARWAGGPECAVGEWDDGVVDPSVSAALRSATDVSVCPSVPWEGVRHSVGIEALTCDGLPLVGAMPGSSRVLVGCGFGGTGTLLAALSGIELAETIVGRTPRVRHDGWSSLGLRRFLA